MKIRLDMNSTTTSASSKTSDVLIIGGGIVGCAMAERLARAGLQTTLLERGIIGREASWAAAGMLAPQSEMPEPGSYFEFCLASRRLYDEETARIREASGIDPQHRREGMYYLAADDETARTLRERAAWQKPLGLGVHEIAREVALAEEPSLAPDFQFVMHFAEDHSLDPRLMTRGYAIAARKLGAKLIEYAPVTRLLKNEGRVEGIEAAGVRYTARWTILTSGCWSGLIPDLEFSLPTYPVKGQMALVQDRPGLLSRTIHTVGIYLVPRLDGRIVIGATEEHEAGFDKTVEAGAVGDLLARAMRLVPAIEKSQLVDSWAGLRPGTPDRRPVIGSSPMEGLLLATGHFRNGVLLAPITAHRVAQFIETGKWAEDVTEFGAARFARDSRRESTAKRD